MYQVCSQKYLTNALSHSFLSLGRSKAALFRAPHASVRTTNMVINEYLAGFISGLTMIVFTIVISASMKPFITPLKAVKIISVVISFLFLLAAPPLSHIAWSNGWIEFVNESFAGYKHYFMHLGVGFASIFIGYWLFYVKFCSNNTIKKDV